MAHNVFNVKQVHKQPQETKHVLLVHQVKFLKPERKNVEISVLMDILRTVQNVLSVQQGHKQHLETKHVLNVMQGLMLQPEPKNVL